MNYQIKSKVYRSLTLLSLTLSFCLGGCAQNDIKEPEENSTPKSEIPQEESSLEEEKSVQELDDEVEDFDNSNTKAMIMATLNNTLSESNPQSVYLDDEKLYVILFEADKEAFYTAVGANGSCPQWTEYSDSVNKLCATVKELVDQQGFTNINIELYITNPQSSDKYVFISHNGETTYDYFE